MTNKVSNKANQNGIKASNRQDQKMDLVPFMDTFYALASDEGKERSLAASSMLRHLFSQDISADDDTHKIAVIKDGYYAFARLLKGLCSGRASARQGYASCLSTFLELSFKLGPDSGLNSDPKKCWMEYYMENGDTCSKPSNADLSPSEFVRDQLMKHTVESSSGDRTCTAKRAKGGAEERDRMYGKLFGILAVVRSQTLFHHVSSVKVMKRYIIDLLSLYNYKNWMREPSTHALQELVSSIYENSSVEKLTDLVDTTLPSFFDCSHHKWTAEKISIYLHLQTIYMNAKIICDDIVLPKTLRSPLLTSAALTGESGSIAATLKGTSKVVHPRCHMVWNSIWSYLTLPKVNLPETSNGKGYSSKNINKKAAKNICVSPSEGCLLRHSLILGSEPPDKILKSIVNGVISFSLLGNKDQVSSNIVSENIAVTGTTGITNERRALALTLVHQLCKLHLSETILEHVVLQPNIVTRLFIHTMCSSKQNTMKPLATHILKEITASMIVDCDSGEPTALIEKRLAFIRALIKANPAFDSVSKTNTVALLLSLKNTEDDNSIGSKQDELWNSYFSFLKRQVFLSYRSPETTKKYIDLIYLLANRVLKFGSMGTCEKLLRSILCFLMVGGLFDVKELHTKENNGQTNETSNKFLESALVNQKHLMEVENASALPYIVRVAMSSRFFTILSEAISTPPSLKVSERGSKQALRDAKAKNALEILDFVRLGWRSLENNGALPFVRKHENSNDTKSIVTNCRTKGDNLYSLLESIDSKGHTPKTRAISGIVCLVSSLAIQLLNPGSPSSTESSDWEDLDEEESDNSAEEVNEIIFELSHIAESLNENQPVANLEEDEDLNKLLPLAVICVNILSTSLGGNSFKVSSSHGQAGKLVRLLTTSAWIACVSAPTADTFLVDKDVMDTILQAVCGSTCKSFEDDNDVDSDVMEEEGEEVFGFSGSETPMDMDDVYSSSDENVVKPDIGGDGIEEEDIELDPSSLQNLLLEDSDTEEKDLEHHAGADSALAQLIKMKQDARKAGKEHREKIELVYKMRCMVLLEEIFSCDTIVSQNTVMMSIRPILRARKELDKSTASTMSGTEGKRMGFLLNEKLALLGRISTLLEKKIAKFDLKNIAQADDCVSLVSDLIDDLKTFKSLSHRSCCSALLIMMVKAITLNFDESIITISSLFQGAVEEWSTKRKSNLASSIFAELINRIPSFSRRALPMPLATASLGARSPFYKIESLCLIASLYSISVKDDVEMNSAEAISLNKALPSIADAIAAALIDKELMKAKKSRDVLKATEKVVAYCNNNKSCGLWSSVTILKESLEHLSKNTQGAGVESRCAKILKDILEGEKSQNFPKSSQLVSNKKKKKSKKAIHKNKGEDIVGKKKRKKVKNKDKD